jgi:dihydrofolate reductase
MGRVVVVNNVTLDGVMQAPARPDEDTRDGFPYGGWAAPYADQVMMERMSQDMGRPGAMLFGRRTYEDLFSAWHGRTDNSFTAVLDNAQKYVASTTLEEPLPWQNSTLLNGDAADAVERLKHGQDGVFTILGSGVLISSLTERDLVDEYLLSIYPLVLGTGRRLFGPDQRVPFEMTDSVVTTTGVIIATYRRVPSAAVEG